MPILDKKLRIIKIELHLSLRKKLLATSEEIKLEKLESDEDISMSQNEVCTQDSKASASGSEESVLRSSATRRPLRPRMFRCGVDFCNNNSFNSPKLSFFNLPTSLARRTIWLQNIKLVYDEDTRCQVCEKHFIKSFINYNAKRRRLSIYAVPTEFLPMDAYSAANKRVPMMPALLQNNIEIDLEEVSATASFSNNGLVDSYLDDTKVQVKTELEVTFDCVENKQEPESVTFYVDTLDQDHEQLLLRESDVGHHVETYTNIASLAPITDKLNKRKPKKQKFSSEFKMFALGLYVHHPHSYRALYSTFKLPRVSILYRIYIPSTTQLSQHLLEGLQLKVKEMSKTQRQCVVCVGTMNLTPNVHYDAKKDKFFGFQDLNGVQTLEPANTALIILVRGLFHDWKQAVAFSFLSRHQDSEHVKLFIDQVIDKLFVIGLDVRAYMSDLETDAITAAKSRNIGSKTPFFNVNARKVYYMYDPVYLLKSTRDILMSCKVVYNSLVVNWSYIRQCFQLDSNNQIIRLAPKLTDDHFKRASQNNNVSNLDKLRLEKCLLEELTLVTDIFSLSTARAMVAYIEAKTLLNAEHTMEFIIIMAKLIDMLNFSLKNPPEDKSAVFSGKPEQIDFLLEMLSLLYNIRHVRHEDDNDSTSQVEQSDEVPFVEGFRLTINAVMLLYGDLTKEQCCHPIVGLTRDCLLDFFNKINEKFGLKPTAHEVVSSISSFPIFNIFQFSPRKRITNGVGDFIAEARLFNIKMYDNEFSEYVDMCADESKEFDTLKLPNERKSEYVSLYLLSRGYLRHSECSRMKNYLCLEDSEAAASHLVPNIAFMVPRKFVLFVETLEQYFKYYFQKETAKCNSLSALMHLVDTVTFDMPCECFPLQYIKQLYMRYRLHLVLTYNRQLFNETDHDQIVFVVNDL